MHAFEFHTGYELTEKRSSKGEVVYEMNCPFCDDETGHFHFFETTQYGCKKCGCSGNVYDFIKGIYQQCVQDLGELPKQRQLPERALSGIKFNRLNNTFVLPTYKLGKMNNLYKTGDNLRLLGTPTLTGTLYDWEEETNEEIWLCEGQWDRCAAKAIIGTNRPITAVGIPGANSFKESWAGAFRDKDVVLIFDNDDAGEAGRVKTIKAFESSSIKPKSLRFVKWPKNTPDKYDLRDCYVEHGRQAYKALQDFIQPVDAPQAIRVKTHSVLEDFTCDSYDKALDHFENAFHTTSDMRAALASVMASIYSINIPGEQVWLKIIGPPGCGKSSIAKAVSGSEHVVMQSTFTGLFSGYIDGTDDDHGMIPIITNKTLIVKDADPLLQQGNAPQIMSELRDFYDKSSSVRYRTGKSYEYHDVKSTVIICGTQVLRRADQSFLGERFLALEMDVSAADQEAISQKILLRGIEMAMGVIKDPEIQIQSAMKGWLNHLRERKLDTTIPKEFQQNVVRLCSLTALMRTQVDRDNKGKVASPAVPEMPGRLIGQVLALSFSLGAVFGKNVADHKEFSIVQKVLRDTINPRSHRFKICDVLAENPNMDAFDLEDSTHIPRTTLNEELADLTELGLLHISAKPGDKPGRRRHIFRLDDRVANPMRDLL
jgi:5S rRNA maturation endonuclease (ribonuclease M5)/energy-coupling factor transporter ATP-binding protein EcfA2